MKIAEYIELVKQAETPQEQIPTPPPFEERVESTNPGPPPVSRNGNWLGSFAEANNIEHPESVSERLSGKQRHIKQDYWEYDPVQVDRRTGLLKRLRPVQSAKGTPEAFNQARQFFNKEWKPYKTTLPSWRELNAKRTRWKAFTDHFNPKYYAEWGKHIAHKVRYPKEVFWDMAKGLPNHYIGTVNMLRERVKPGISKGLVPFALMGPYNQDVYDAIRDNAKYNAITDGVHPELQPWKYYFNYHLPEVGKEVFYRQLPNYATHLSAFARPDIEAVFNTDIGVNFPMEILFNKKPLSGTRKPQGDYRIKTPLDIKRQEEELSRVGKLIPGIVEDTNKRYFGSNLYADLVSPQIEFMTGGPLGIAAFHNFPEIAKLFDNPNLVYYDEDGHAHFDLSEATRLLGTDKGRYEQQGGRPELRNMSETDKNNYINGLKTKAALSGRTLSEIEKGETLLRHPNSNWFIDANRLKLMGIPAKDIYGSNYLRNIEDEPVDANGNLIPKYQQGVNTQLPAEFNTYEYTNPNSPKYNPEVPPGSSDQDWDYRIDNPEYTKAKSKLDRERYDQETLLDLNPFFKANKLKENQLSDEEETLLSDPAELNTLLTVSPPDILGGLREKEIPYAFLPDYEEADDGNGNIVKRELFRKDQRANFINAYVVNKLSQLPVKERYAWLVNNPEYIASFLDTYYTNENTKKKLAEKLWPLRHIAVPKTYHQSLKDSFVDSHNSPQNEYFPNLQDIRQWLDEHER